MTMLSLSAEARPGSVRALRNAVVDAARDAGVPDERLYDVKLCVSEAVTNAVRHAYDNHGGTLRVDVTVDDDEFVVDVVDDGCGIQLGRPVQAGFGLDVISQLSPRSSVETAPGSGTRIELVFPLSAATVDLPWQPKTHLGRQFAL